MKWAPRKGFTIVELLIVIVVIAVLAAVAIVSFSNVQKRARDSQRMTDIRSIDKAIKLYITDRGHAPDFNGICSKANSGQDGNCFASDHDMGGGNSTWADFGTELQPYIKTLPSDPCGIDCWDGETGNFFVYRYNTPGQLPDEYQRYESGSPVGPVYTSTESDYAIYAETLESSSLPFGLGFGSYH